MRLERRGGPPDLQLAFQRLIAQIGGHAYDDNRNEEAAEGEFPDFSCFNDILLIEMKHLETDQSERINDVLDQMISPDDRQVFFGSREIHFITAAAANGTEIEAAITSKLNRSIETILRKANSQFRSYRSRHPRKNSVCLCVILNSTLPEHSPEIVARAIHGKLKPNGRGEQRFSSIDCILYISEKHFSVLPEKGAAFAVIVYECLGAVNNPWKIQFIDRIVDSWSSARTGRTTFAEGLSTSDFSAVSDIPDAMKRYEQWQVEYRRDPYMATISKDMLREIWNRTLAVGSVYMLKGDWPKPSLTEFQESMRMLQHLIEETNRRGIDIRDLDKKLLSPVQLQRVYRGLPATLVSLLSGNGDDESE